eukprot:TRINITY_DN2209_c0_g1_i3.p1 TRINITY_DN2209_c0_g1~~TRINITY_DN2209_c0_g1_i3.p1  ORF type:complete len:370 (+),score=46.40 TRINITY_DN2209_c0_g1_i3:199-1308(+)
MRAVIKLGDTKDGNRVCSGIFSVPSLTGFRDPISSNSRVLYQKACLPGGYCLSCSCAVEQLYFDVDGDRAFRLVAVGKANGRCRAIMSLSTDDGPPLRVIDIELVHRKAFQRNPDMSTTPSFILNVSAPIQFLLRFDAPVPGARGKRVRSDVEPVTIFENGVELPPAKIGHSSPNSGSGVLVATPLKPSRTLSASPQIKSPSSHRVFPAVPLTSREREVVDTLLLISGRSSTQPPQSPLFGDAPVVPSVPIAPASLVPAVPLALAADSDIQCVTAVSTLQPPVMTATAVKDELGMAILTGDVAHARKLVSQGVSPTSTSLVLALQKRDFGMVKILLNDETESSSISDVLQRIQDFINADIEQSKAGVVM